MKYKKHLQKLSSRQAFYEAHPDSAAESPMAKKAFRFTKPGSNKK